LSEKEQQSLVASDIAVTSKQNVKSLKPKVLIDYKKLLRVLFPEKSPMLTLVYIKSGEILSRQLKKWIRKVVPGKGR